ncbi:hypothetical protein GCM10012290_04050 [Halolactibacillus alkaliphilus]|uniref:DNA-binding protein n=2 Tax=Halolactibacillus alkaliphilus TaxID=442899 RepID=A0A511WYL4_9BACI|nr:hypothetical protein HAL01_01470 [Halolactibacillus alkaliphilus]GGN65411.1 hypothetical protein GCM10012290_04050 [Halolactibacillus alkaliphilus]SFO63799.1 uncharacterized protein SAMN05720591_10210 [Halolactibacillus alkaliphilus]
MKKDIRCKEKILTNNAFAFKIKLVLSEVINMKLSIQKILQQAPYSFEGETDVSELVSFDNDIRQVGSVQVSGVASIQNKTITVNLSIKGVMVLPCARSLVDVDYPFEVDTIEVFSIDPFYTEEDESEIHPIKGEILDLTPFIKENVLLEIPFRVYADKEAIEKYALTAGDGWSVVEEDNVEKKIDPRLSKLQSLLTDDKNENPKE